MYNEANFYRLSLLRASIEDRVPDPRQRLCDERYGLTHQVAAPTGALGAMGVACHSSANVYLDALVVAARTRRSRATVGLERASAA